MAAVIETEKLTKSYGSHRGITYKRGAAKL
jgi:hypothetical protein